MFYLYQGYVHITPAGQQEKTWKDVCQRFKRDWQQARIATYIFFVYTKKDNHYWRVPPLERKERVWEAYNFGEKWPNIEKYSDLEAVEEVAALISFYSSISLSDNDLNEMAFRLKAEKLRKKLLDNDDVDEDEKIAKALATATKLAQEYNLKAELEAGNDNSEGCPHYLFEVPENKKDPHLKLKL